MIAKINRAIGERLASFLTKSPPNYQRLDNISLKDVASVLQPGDIILVEGDTRISTAIKYLTQSSWSHACLYISASGSPVSNPTLLEADLVDGVRIVSLDHYAGFNLRICRPIGLDSSDKQKIIKFAKSKIGYKYDLKNIVDLVRYLIQKPMVPNRYRRAMISLGSGEPTKAICSTLIAESFQAINYPILPLIKQQKNTEGGTVKYYKRHFTHFTPRDFDVSPYFRVIKPTIEKGFDFRNLKWEDVGENEDTAGLNDS